MDATVSKMKDFNDLFSDDASFLTSDEDIALHIMHRFNIDRETIESLPAFDEPLRPLFWPNRK